MSAKWSTPEELDAARETIAASIDGWREPAAYAVGLTSATSSAETEFPRVNVGQSYLPALVMAKTIGYANGSVTHLLTSHELRHAIDGLAPAESVKSKSTPLPQFRTRACVR